MKGRKLLFESLSKKVSTDVATRRYSLSELVSESYKALYESKENTNMRKLVESHINSLRSNPSEIDTLSKQLCSIKHALRMLESNEIEDAELLVPEEKHTPVEPKEEEEITESAHDEDVEEKDDEDLLEDSELTDEEVEELTKHLEEIRKKNKVNEKKECDSSTVKESKARKLKKRVTETEDPSPEVQDLIMSALADVIYGFGVEPNDLGELLDNLVYNVAKLMPKNTNESKSYQDLKISDFAKKSTSKAFVKTFKKLDKKLHEGTALTRQESISLYKAANSAMTHLSVELEHNPEFIDTFNESVSLLSVDVSKLLESMKKDKAPSKATMKSLAKFCEVLLREGASPVTIKDSDEEIKYIDDGAGFVAPGEVVTLALIKEYWNDNLEADRALSEYESFDAWFTETKENYLKDYDGDLEEAEDEELPPLEDEEELAVGEDEEEAPGESEEEELDQEYADARVELHKEIAEEHADSDNAYVQEKIAQDAEEVLDLPGITDEQVAEINAEFTGVSQETNTEETIDDTSEEDTDESKETDIQVDDEDITDEELAELKKHLKEMRSVKSLGESKARKLKKKN